jgi:acyl carrier protein
MDEVKDVVRQFILSNYLQGERPENVRDDTALQTSGILDSLAVLGLATFLEKRYGLELAASETGLEHFDRIEDIARLIAVKRQRAAVA